MKHWGLTRKKIALKIGHMEDDSLSPKLKTMLNRAIKTGSWDLAIQSVELDCELVEAKKDSPKKKTGLAAELDRILRRVCVLDNKIQKNSELIFEIYRSISDLKQKIDPQNK
ncbi:hypothetical protein K9M41_01765 [Candidatus Gracilibacteria bacterium]|nr:hypothetical protein [Candidatus Gracilibacteria bacterium]